tara:strand:+ start:850 stop:1473 length:624 start_codon:yes stop_codon:yes gene_type:complete
MNSRLILALDVTNPERAMEIAKEAAPHLAFVKVNYPLVLSAGLDVVTEISKSVPVICDFKVADIPNTNRLIAEAAYGAGAQGLIVHGFTGTESVSACKSSEDKDLFVVITMSHPGGGEFFDIDKFSTIAKQAGATGVVAPATRPEDITEVREKVGNLTIISPGVGAQGGSAKDAIDAGADYIIVGRSIYQSDNPAEAAYQYSQSIGD